MSVLLACVNIYLMHAEPTKPRGGKIRSPGTGVADGCIRATM